MKAVIQRVSSGRVTVKGEETGAIGAGIVLLLGAAEGDDESDLNYILEKTIHLRIFPDPEGKMNLSLMDVEGELLVISQFTLLGDTKKGRRPSFVRALEPVRAQELYELFIARAKELGVKKVATGRFGAMMDVDLINHGPVTLILDSKKD